MTSTRFARSVATREHGCVPTLKARHPSLATRVLQHTAAIIVVVNFIFLIKHGAYTLDEIYPHRACGACVERAGDLPYGHGSITHGRVVQEQA
jgi:hypothetical protein